MLNLKNIYIFYLFLLFEFFSLFSLVTSNGEESSMNPSKDRLLSGSTSSSSSSSSSNCTQSSETHPDLFGSLVTAQSPGAVFGSVAIIVVVVQIVERVFDFLLEITAETPFEKVIILIQQELMVVGFTALLFKVIFDTTHFLDHTWFFALEYSDILVPIYTFSSCALGIILVIASMNQISVWHKAFYLHLDEILMEYYNFSHRSLLHWFPLFSRTISAMEFRIFHNIFCDMYQIEKTIAFNEYISIVVEKYILSVIGIRLVDWILMMGMLAIMLTDSETWSFSSQAIFGACHQANEEEILNCQSYHSAYFFTMIGGVIFLMTCIISVVTRSYELSIMRKRGIMSIHEYVPFLKFMETNKSVIDKEKKKLTKDQLKSALNNAKEKRRQEAKHDHQFFYYLFTYPSILYLRLFSATTSAIPDIVTQIEKLATDLGQDIENAIPSFHEKNYNTNYIPADDPIVDVKRENNECVFPSAKNNLYSSQKSIKVSPENNNSDGVRSSSSKIEEDQLLEEGKVKIKNKYEDPKNTSAENNHQRVNVKQKADFVRTIFLFSYPDLYFEVLKVLVMIVNAYNALWLSNYMAASPRYIWKFITIIPGLLCMFNLQYCVKTAALFKSMHTLDEDAMLTVIEDMEGSKQLAAQIRDKLLSRLHSTDDHANLVPELFKLFREVDDNGSNKLSRLEFEDLMYELDVYFSRKKWNQIFYEIDRNFDNNISFEEFFIFIFPEHAAAKAIETDRLDQVNRKMSVHLVNASDSMKRLISFAATIEQEDDKVIEDLEEEP